MSKKRTLWKAVSLTLSVALVGSCGGDGNGVGPDLEEEFDPVAIRSALSDIGDQFVTDNTAITGVAAVSGCYVAFLGGLAASPGNDVTATAVDARVPPELLGTTLVQDPVSGTCGADESRTDAPADGVRLEFYETDASGDLVSPLNAIGYVDLVDNSTASTLDIDFTSVVSGQTLIDFSLDATITETAFDLNASGFVSDGAEQLTFGAMADLTATETAISGNGTFSASTTDFTFMGAIDADVDLDAGTGSGSGDLSFTENGNTTSLSATLTEAGTATVDINFNDALVATATADINDDNVTFAGPGGDPLPQADVDALGAIADAAGAVLEPLLSVVVLAVALSGFGF